MVHSTRYARSSPHRFSARGAMALVNQVILRFFDLFSV